MNKPKDEILDNLAPKERNGIIKPAGAISVREASRKYDIPRSNVSRWANKGYIEIKARAKNWLFIDENSLILYLDSRKN